MTRVLNGDLHLVGRPVKRDLLAGASDCRRLLSTDVGCLLGIRPEVCWGIGIVAGDGLAAGGL
jgi:hypothetical protein